MRIHLSLFIGTFLFMHFAEAGTPTTFDSGYNRDGYKTYVIHGVEKVDKVSRGIVVLSPRFEKPGLGLDIGAIQAEAIGFTENKESVALEDPEIVLDANNKLQPVLIRFHVKTSRKITKVVYIFLVSTKENVCPGAAINDLAALRSR